MNDNRPGFEIILEALSELLDSADIPYKKLHYQGETRKELLYIWFETHGVQVVIGSMLWLRDYECCEKLLKDGTVLRGTFFIDLDGVLHHNGNEFGPEEILVWDVWSDCTNVAKEEVIKSADGLKVVIAEIVEDTVSTIWEGPPE